MLVSPFTENLFLWTDTGCASSLVYPIALRRVAVFNGWWKDPITAEVKQISLWHCTLFPSQISWKSVLCLMPLFLYNFFAEKVKMMIIKQTGIGVLQLCSVYGIDIQRGSPGEGNNNPLQCSWLGCPTDRGAWQAAVHRVAKESDTT